MLAASPRGVDTFYLERKKNYGLKCQWLTKFKCKLNKSRTDKEARTKKCIESNKHELKMVFNVFISQTAPV